MLPPVKVKSISTSAKRGLDQGRLPAKRPFAKARSRRGRFQHPSTARTASVRERRPAGLWIYGEYQMGELQARSCMVAGRSGLGGTPCRMASHVDQRQLGFSSTRR